MQEAEKILHEVFVTGDDLPELTEPSDQAFDFPASLHWAKRWLCRRREEDPRADARLGDNVVEAARCGRPFFDE